MTPAIKQLEALGTAFTVHSYAHEPRADSYGLEAAEHLGAQLGIEPDRIFKTLVVELSNSASHARDPRLAVAVLPVTEQLAMKRVATNLKAKKATMANPEKVQRITGYVLGGVSPIGQARALPTLIDESAKCYATIFISAGKRGLELEISPDDLQAACAANFAQLS